MSGLFGLSLQGTVVSLLLSHLLALVVGWWAKAQAYAKAEVKKATPEAEKLVADAKAEAEKLVADAKAEAAKLLADAKKL